MNQAKARCCKSVLTNEPGGHAPMAHRLAGRAGGTCYGVAFDAMRPKWKDRAGWSRSICLKPCLELGEECAGRCTVSLGHAESSCQVENQTVHARWVIE